MAEGYWGMLAFLTFSNCIFDSLPVYVTDARYPMKFIIHDWLPKRIAWPEKKGQTRVLKNSIYARMMRQIHWSIKALRMVCISHPPVGQI